jgi:geranylgeranyl reductase family protein
LEDEMLDVLVVGAGPVGCKVGELLAKENFEVLIVEEHAKVGRPVQCAGLVSHRIFELSGVSEDFIVNTVEKARFYAPGSCMELKSREKVYVIDREKFDKESAKRAEASGAKIKKNTKFLSYKKKRDSLGVKTDKGIFHTKLLVGADGPNSSVARAAGIKLPKNVLTGVQTTVKSSFNPDSVELWFGSKVSPDFFGWVIPENEKWGRIGLAASRNTVNLFRNFIVSRLERMEKSKDNIAGVIRYGLIESSVSDRVILVGDAASQVKPFSGGGLIYGLIGAEFATKACKKSLEEERYDHEFLKENYDDVWKEKLAWPIRKGLIMSKLIHSFSDDQLSFFFSLLQKGRLTKLLEFTDMDLL